MNTRTKIDRLKDFHNWLYVRVQNVNPMDCETFDNILEKI